MDLATELGEQGFRHIFVVHGHGAPYHNLMLDQAGAYFRDTYGGRMVHLRGLMPNGEQMARLKLAPPNLNLSEAETKKIGAMDEHAGFDETSRLMPMSGPSRDKLDETCTPVRPPALFHELTSRGYGIVTVTDRRSKAHLAGRGRQTRKGGGAPLSGDAARRRAARQERIRGAACLLKNVGESSRTGGLFASGRSHLLLDSLGNARRAMTLVCLLVQGCAAPRGRRTRARYRQSVDGSVDGSVGVSHSAVSASSFTSVVTESGSSP